MARALINIPTSGNIGDVKASMLTLAQFQAINGVNWVLANGSSAVGTTYAAITGASNVPDMRGVFLRGKNNGRADGNQNPDGDYALGYFQNHGFQTHGHSYTDWGHVHGIPSFNAGGGSVNINNNYNGSQTTNVGYGSVTELKATGITIDGPNSGNPANETRPRNVTVNYFIKVN